MVQIHIGFLSKFYIGQQIAWSWTSWVDKSKLHKPTFLFQHWLKALWYVQTLTDILNRLDWCDERTTSHLKIKWSEFYQTSLIKHVITCFKKVKSKFTSFFWNFQTFYEIFQKNQYFVGCLESLDIFRNFHFPLSNIFLRFSWM